MAQNKGLEWDMDYRVEYDRWLRNVADPELLEELKQMDESQVEDAFYRDLAFGTGGLRGTIGAGTNRMNRYVVAKASQGLAEYLLSLSVSSGEAPSAGGGVAAGAGSSIGAESFSGAGSSVGAESFSGTGSSVRTGPSVVIGYDSRIKSDVFARVAAEVFAANGIVVHIWPQLLPVPTVSFAVRELGASAGVMITASHNPSRYNGYKVYGPDGCQITTEAAKAILARINSVDIFTGVKTADYEQQVEAGVIRLIDPSVLTHYLEAVKSQSVLYGDPVRRDVAIVYSPLNGTGLVPVTRVLAESGYDQVAVVEEQREPDGHFPTCPYPNPEIREAMMLGLEYCRKMGADLLIATDPDCDRCGIAVKDGSDYRLLTGNEVGLLLLDYICSQRQKHGKMPVDPVFVKTIVTMDLAEKIADHYGARTVNVLTGFKFIGEVIGKLEAEGREKDYICGFEESYGYLTGSYVRDKDGVNAAFLICEMFAYYKTRGVTLPQKLNELYGAYGFCRNTLHSYEFPGSAGMQKMNEIMSGFRVGLDALGGSRIVRTEDYREGLNGLPKSDVLKFFLENGSVVVRPSGTEPKLKIYVSITAQDEDAAKAREREIVAQLEARMR